jgi:hypothetical protein
LGRYTSADAVVFPIPAVLAKAKCSSDSWYMVGSCRFIASKPVLKPRLVSALETNI